MEGPGDHYRWPRGAPSSLHLSPHRDSPIIFRQSIVVGFAPALLSLHTIPDARHRAASANLAQARAEARTFGDERRAAIHARVAAFERHRGREDSDSPS
jgi:hypothetical protein